MFMDKPTIQKDFIEELCSYKRSKDNLIDNDKIFFTCDVCQCKSHGSHMWVKDEKSNPDNGRLPGYDWIKYPEGWLVMWTVNGPIHVCSKICAVRLNTDLFYDED